MQRGNDCAHIVNDLQRLGKEYCVKRVGGEMIGFRQIRDDRRGACGLRVRAGLTHPHPMRKLRTADLT